MARTKTLGEQTGLSEEAIQQNRSTPLAHLPGLRMQTYGALKRAGIGTVGELARRSANELLVITDFGTGSLGNVQSALTRYARGERATSLPAVFLLERWLEAQPSLPQEMTLQEIGSAIGLSRERVRQLLNKLGVSERKGPKYVYIYTRHIIDEGHPGYGAYIRALSRGAPESVARAHARQAEWIYNKRQDPEYVARARAYQAKWAYNKRQDPEYRERVNALQREGKRRRYREDPDYRARTLERNRRTRAQKRERQATGESAVEG